VNALLNVRVVVHDDQPFHDRSEAGELLAWELRHYRNGSTVVLGIPRGGIIIAQRVARALGAPLDIILSCKIGAPGDPDLAIGAIAENGTVFLDDTLPSQLYMESTYIQREESRQKVELERRIVIYRKGQPRLSLTGKTVLVVDDGMATGLTMKAALLTARQETPHVLIAAVPVAPEETLEKVARHADEVLCLRSPRYFHSLRRFYRSPEQLDDDRLLRLLHL
jgi:predicted phosphoribosyltransferase